MYMLIDVPDPPAGDYQQVRSWADEASQTFRAELAARLEPAFNGLLAGLPRTTLDDKRSLCKLVNHELARYGLAVSCPKSGRAAYLGADNSTGGVARGKFTFGVTKADGRPTHLGYYAELPHLTLTANDGSRVQGVDWYERVRTGQIGLGESRSPGP